MSITPKQVNNMDKSGNPQEKPKGFGNKRIRAAWENYQTNPKCCLNCDKQIPFENRRNKFCSHSCSATYSNKRRPSISKRSQYCSCGKQKKVTNQFCDECIKNRVYSRKDNLFDAETDSTRRKILLRQRGHKCERCHLSEWMNELIPLELHHVDGNPDHNTAENLKLLCPNCHAQTDTFKAANKGSSTRHKERRRRYEEGLTF